MTHFTPGDLITFHGCDPVSRVIEVATLGPSHVGIICLHNNEPLLVESTTLCPWPCVIRGIHWNGVQAHRPEDRIETYPGSVERLRLAPIWSLSNDESELLSRILIRHCVGQPYDLAGALVSGTRLLKWSRLLPYADLGSQFCSEMVAAVLMRLARMPIRNPALYNPASLVRALRRSGVYSRPEVIAHA